MFDQRRSVPHLPVPDCGKAAGAFVRRLQCYLGQTIGSHPNIAESAVAGLADALKGQLPVGFYVTNDGVQRDLEELQAELVARVRDAIGPVAAFKTAIELKRLPKTRSGKVLRGTIQKIGDGADRKMPAAIDDPETLAEIQDALVRKAILKQG